MAVASSDMPIKQLMGSTYSAGFDLTARTPVDGRLGVKTLADLTNEKAWRSRSQKDDQHPEYWLFNGLFTSVAETGKIYVLVGIDESQPATVWPDPAGPGTITTGPRWVELGGADNFLQEASIVVAKYGYIQGADSPGYYEEGDPNFDHVYSDPECTTEVSASKYLKLVVKESDGSSGSVRKILYCDVSDLVGNVQTLTIQANGQLVMEFNGNQPKTINFVGTDNVNIKPATSGSGVVDVGLVWLGLDPAKFHILFVDWDGSILSEQNIRRGGTPVTPPDPVREGHTFIGWEPAVSPATADVTYTATYQVVYVWPGNTNEYISRVPDDNTFVGTNPSTGTSSSYKMKAHMVEVDEDHIYTLNHVSSTEAYGYSFGKNVDLHITLPDDYPSWTLYVSIINRSSGSGSTKTVSFMDDERTLLRSIPVPYAQEDVAVVTLTNLSPGSYILNNDSGSTLMIGLIAAKSE